MLTDKFIRQAMTSVGIKNVDAQSLKDLLPELDEKGYWVTRLEAHELRGTREIMELQYSIIGLDGSENWENHQNIDRHNVLVRKTINEALASDVHIQFRVWIEEVE